MRPALLITCLVCAALPVGADLGRAAQPSPVVFPIQRIPLSFSHVEHLSKGKVGCAFCHENAPDSVAASDNNIPKEEVCAVCHEIERDKPLKEVPPGKPSARCDSCHPGWSGVGQPPRVMVPAPNLKFNHKVHVGAPAKVRCQTCHGDLAAEGVALATRDNLPRMPLCLSCHDGKRAPSRCATCHLTQQGGYLQTSFAEGLLAPSGSLRGDAHDLRFRLDHARVAANDERYCESCHKKEYCVGCHNGVAKPLDFHGNDYVSLHPLDARRNDPDCSACHRLQTFCTGCHSRSGVTTDDRTSQLDRHTSGGPNRMHSAGWFTTFEKNQRTSDHHSFQAQRNIRTCASCHREEFCVGCHAPTTFGVDPHPAGWRSSARCRALTAKNGRVCLRCHIDANDARCD